MLLFFYFKHDTNSVKITTEEVNEHVETDNGTDKVITFTTMQKNNENKEFIYYSEQVIGIFTNMI